MAVPGEVPAPVVPTNPAPAVRVPAGTGTILSTPWEAYNVGLSNQLGRLRGSSPSSALESYEAAAADDFVPALLNLGYLQETGAGGVPNPSRAVRHYERAADLGSLAAHYNLGRIYLQGSGTVPVDLGRARRHLTRAAEGGILPAQYLLGRMSLEAEKAPEAFAWVMRSAGHGYVPAMHLVGHLYLHGKGVAADASKALLWLQRAAAQDFAAAYHDLGVLHDVAVGFRDPAAAVALFRKAAERGHREAQYQLGYCHYAGRGTAVDLAEAFRWWTLAEASGLDAAGHARARLAPRMAAADLSRGQELVAAFKPVASAYVEPDKVEVAIASDARPGSRLGASATGTGFFVSESGHLLLGSRVLEGSGEGSEVFIPGGQLRVRLLQRNPGLGLSLGQAASMSRSFRPLPLDTNRAGLVAGRTVYVAAVSPGDDGGVALEWRLIRTRIASATGPRANPRQITLEGRFGPGFAGCPVLDPEGRVLAVVAEPTPEDPPADGTCAVTARQVLEFVRSAGVDLSPASEASSPVVEGAEPTAARSSLAFVAGPARVTP